VTTEDDKLRKLLHARFDPVLEEPIPVRMHLRAPAWIEYARAAAFVVAGVLIGLAIPFARQELPRPAAAPTPQLPTLAARAHYVYSREKRHAVEVAAAEHLDVPLKVPVLAPEGYELMGGRLLPGTDAPVAQFMYQDKAQRRLTVYVAGKTHKDPVTAFRYIQEGPVSVFYWVDADCGYAISGEMDRAELSRIANVVYKQLEEH
jgi:anti-sigma factor RsiW